MWYQVERQTSTTPLGIMATQPIVIVCPNTTKHHKYVRLLGARIDSQNQRLEYTLDAVSGQLNGCRRAFHAKQEFSVLEPLFGDSIEQSRVGRHWHCHE